MLMVATFGGTDMAAGNFKTATRTFSNLYPITIITSIAPPTEASPYPSRIKVR